MDIDAIRALFVTIIVVEHVNHVMRTRQERTSIWKNAHVYHSDLSPELENIEEFERSCVGSDSVEGASCKISISKNIQLIEFLFQLYIGQVA